MFKGDCERMNWIKGKLRRKKIDAKENFFSFCHNSTQIQEKNLSFKTKTKGTRMVKGKLSCVIIKNEPLG